MELKPAPAAGSSGDVVGPATSTDNAIARFDSTTGKLLQNAVVTVSDAGAIAGSTGLSMDATSTISYGGNVAAYVSGTGPRWLDTLGSEFAFTFNLQSLADNRAVVWPNADGTVTVISAVGTTVGAAGGASALPATPLGYATFKLPDGTEVVMPYYTKP